MSIILSSLCWVAALGVAILINYVADKGPE